jgi:hypothetical protein
MRPRLGWSLLVVLPAAVAAGCSGGGMAASSGGAPPVQSSPPPPVTSTAPGLAGEPQRLIRLCGTTTACDDFASPTRNLRCFASAAQGGYVECDVRSGLQPTPPRGTCELDQPGVTMTASGPAAVSCRGDPTPAGFDRRIPVLPYGHVWQGFGFTCTSRITGITCRRADHGFFVSRERWRVF